MTGPLDLKWSNTLVPVDAAALAARPRARPRHVTESFMTGNGNMYETIMIVGSQVMELSNESLQARDAPQLIGCRGVCHGKVRPSSMVNHHRRHHRGKVAGRHEVRRSCLEAEGGNKDPAGRAITARSVWISCRGGEFKCHFDVIWAMHLPPWASCRARMTKEAGRCGGEGTEDTE